MTVEQLQKAYKAEPFQPFVVHLADGREFSVPHREFLWLVPNSRTFAVAHPDGSAEIFDLLLVTSLEFKANGNGSRKRRKP